MDIHQRMRSPNVTWCSSSINGFLSSQFRECTMNHSDPNANTKVQPQANTKQRARYRFVCTKLRSWRTGYQRVVCLYDDHFLTLDPDSGFRETNRFSYGQIVRQPVALPQEANCVLIELGSGSGVTGSSGSQVDKLKLRCEHCHCSWLLTALIELWSSYKLRQQPTRCLGLHPMNHQQHDLFLYPTFQCYRQRRTGDRVPCLLRVLPHALVECECHNMNGNSATANHHVGVFRKEHTIQEYRYVHVSQVGFTVDDPNGIVIHITGRGRLFFVTGIPSSNSSVSLSSAISSTSGGRARSDLASAMKRAADQIGVPFVIGQGTMVETWLQNRSELGSNAGEAICSYRVTKQTLRHKNAVVRIIVVTSKYIVEKDPETGTTVSTRELSSVFAIVRNRGSETELCIEYKDGLSRTYFSTERDACACSILDACFQVGNASVSITEEKSDGSRLIPRNSEGATGGGKSGGLMETIFGGDSIEMWLLNRLAYSTSLLVGASSTTQKGDIMPEIIEAASDFNANIPTSGLTKGVDKKVVSSSLPSIITVVNFLLSANNGVPRDSSEKFCATLIQSIYRIVRSQAGFQCCLEIPNSLDTFENLLQMRDSFSLFWSVKLLNALVTCPNHPRDREQEFVNKQLLLGRHRIIDALVSLMIGVGSAAGGWSEEPQRSPSTNDEGKQSVSDLILVSTSELLESVLCSGHDTTSPVQFGSLISSISRGYGALMEMLRSKCAIVVENAALLLQLVTQYHPATSTLIRHSALSSALVLRHFYLAIFSPSESQRFLSRYLVSLWMSGDLRCDEKQLLARMIPSGFLPYLNMPPLSDMETDIMDELERGGIEASDNYGRVVAPSTLPRDKDNKTAANITRLRQRIQIANAKFNDGNIHPSENFRTLFHVITKDHALPDLLWNQQTRRELRISLESELRSIER